jgi:hypothetical protein
MDLEHRDILKKREEYDVLQSTLNNQVSQLEAKRKEVF